MSTQITGPWNEREWAQTRDLQEAVLRYLNENGSTDWVTLCLHFDDGTREIGTALGYLSVYTYIAIAGTLA